MDTVLVYHHRLAMLAYALPYASALQTVLRRDEEERAWWTDRVCTSSLTVGKVIREGLCTREIMWCPPPPPQAPSARAATAPPGKGAGKAPGKGAPLGDRLRDGTQVCRKFNLGACTEPCPRGFKHVCNVVLNKSGRLCGMSNHSAANCTQASGKSGRGADDSARSGSRGS